MKKTLGAIVASILLLGSAMGGLIYFKSYKDLLVHDAYRMRWHPDSNHVSFLKDSKLYLMDIENEEKEVILEDWGLSRIRVGTSYHLYDWFPNGEGFVYLRQNSVKSDNMDLVIYNLETKESSVIAENILTHHIDLSPDGSKILYSDYKSDMVKIQGERYKVEYIFSEDSGLYILDVNTLEKTRLVPYEGDVSSFKLWDYGWAPDSNSVFFQKDHSNGPYYLINLDSKSKTSINMEEIGEIYSHCLTYKRSSGTIPSPDGTKYILRKHKGSDMGFVKSHDDFYLKKSKELVCKP